MANSCARSHPRAGSVSWLLSDAGGIGYAAQVMLFIHAVFTAIDHMMGFEVGLWRKGRNMQGATRMLLTLRLARYTRVV